MVGLLLHHFICNINSVIFHIYATITEATIICYYKTVTKVQKIKVLLAPTGIYVAGHETAQ